MFAGENQVAQWSSIAVTNVRVIYQPSENALTSIAMDHVSGCSVQCLPPNVVLASLAMVMFVIGLVSSQLPGHERQMSLALVLGVILAIALFASRKTVLKVSAADASITMPVQSKSFKDAERIIHAIQEVQERRKMRAMEGAAVMSGGSTS
jgi:hypothetical protein